MNSLKEKGIMIKIKGEEQKNREIQNDIFKNAIFSLFAIVLILTWIFGFYIIEQFYGHQYKRRTGINTADVCSIL